ncbi:prolyl-tRNA synthetase associated domain-containing protein [Wukongibacter baidiensis]|uniref:prolyl-tRNA synthetase associated domain-containing protein n=1 Tax=Wukongibacter baidiensis TaxID=1723361 RepID=UPI003D7FCEAC
MSIETEQKVYDVLEKLEIEYEKHEHPPVYTVEEAKKLAKHVTGQGCKNLFIRNRRGNKNYLVVLEDEKKVDLKELSKQIGSTSLSFASKERLYKYLGLEPGSVSPFGLVNNHEKNVEVLIDRDLAKSENISFHPNINTVTLTITYKDFEKFLKCSGNEVSYVDI